jgi:hypothetical protein
MIYNIDEIIMQTAIKHPLVSTVSYRAEEKNDVQPNYLNYKFYIDNEPYLEYTNERTWRYNLNIVIVGFNGKDRDNIRLMQDTALQIGLKVFDRVMKENRTMIQMVDYSYIGVQDYMSDKDAGVRLSISLYVPNLLLMCEPIEWDEDAKIDYTQTNDYREMRKEMEERELTLNPIKLK